MTGKDRIRAAIDLKPVDRVPLGFYVVDYDTIEKVIGRPTYVRNKVKSRIALWEGRRDEVAESYKKDTVEFFRKIPQCDLITFKEAAILPPRDYEPLRPRRINEHTWEDKRGRVYQISELSNDITCVHDPGAGNVEYSQEMFEKPVDLKPPDPSVFEACDYMIGQIGDERYIAGSSGGLTALLTLGGMERGLMMYAERPDIVEAAARRSVKQQNFNDEYFIRAGQDGVLFEQDMAASKGPLISPNMFRRYCMPFMSERVGNVRDRGQQTILHNCGNNRPLIPMFIEAGVQCYESLQSIPDMDIAGLKRDFGDKMCFWGGVSLEVLIQGEPEDVRLCIRQAMEKGAPGGGFILGPSHSIAKGTKYENFMALLDEYERLCDKY